ncbi:MAG: alpha/beta hydrolase [Hyphomicrobiales bacterium]
MSETEPQTLRVETDGYGRDIAVLHRDGAGPGIIWLGGFRSEMTGTKAAALAEHAARAGRAVTRFDYSGHGASGGAFTDGTIGRWLDEATAVFDAFTKGPQIAVGSSMGGWLTLLLARRLAARGESGRLKALVLIAPATDMTDSLMWRRWPDTIRREITEAGHLSVPSQYCAEPTMITRALVEEGRAHLFGDAPIVAGCPVHILHGVDDPDVPVSMSLDLVSRLAEDDVVLTLVKAGDHRLSRPQDIELMLSTVAALGD